MLRESEKADTSSAIYTIKINRLEKKFNPLVQSRVLKAHPQLQYPMNL